MVWYAIMLLAAAAMLFGNHQYKSRRVIWGRPLAGFCGCVSIAAAGIRILDPFEPDVQGIFEEWEAARWTYLGHYLEQKTSAPRVLIINHSTYAHRDFSLKDALKKGCRSLLKVEEASLRAASPEPEMHMPEMVTAESMDRVIDQHPNCNVLISNVGLPHDAVAMALWQRPAAERPLVIIMSGDMTNLEKAIRTGHIQAVIAPRPDADWRLQSPPDDVKAAFEARYVLVDADNVADVRERYPLLFGEL